MYREKGDDTLHCFIIMFMLKRRVVPVKMMTSIVYTRVTQNRGTLTNEIELSRLTIKSAI